MEKVNQTIEEVDEVHGGPVEIEDHLAQPESEVVSSQDQSSSQRQGSRGPRAVASGLRAELSSSAQSEPIDRTLSEEDRAKVKGILDKAKPSSAAKKRYPGGVDDYAEKFEKRTDYIQNKMAPFKPTSEYLYHAAPESSAKLIASGGLKPRDPAWSEDPDASKDKCLSLANKPSGAGAMGGTSVLFRVKVSDLNTAQLRQASATEVLAFSDIQASQLEWRPSANAKAPWRPAAEYGT